jgi:hypothetical protein
VSTGIEFCFSGLVYCGSVGHRHRQEYTVIGHKVNLAARMMTGYPGMISCDEDSVNQSTLPHSVFLPLPKVEMKGLAAGQVKTYQLVATSNELEDIPYQELGRYRSLPFFRFILDFLEFDRIVEFVL